MKSELASRGVSILGLVEKNDLIRRAAPCEEARRCRRSRHDDDVGRPVDGSRQRGARSHRCHRSLREFARQFEDADAPDLARDATSLFRGDGGRGLWRRMTTSTSTIMTMARRRGEDLRRRGSGGRRSVASSPPLAMAIKRGSTKLYNLMSDYIKTVPVEITAMVGVDAFDAFKFTNDARDAFHALRDLDFAELGTIHYEHIYSALDREGDDWYGRSKFVHDDSIDVRAIAKFYRDVVHLTETLRRRNGRRIAIDDAEGSSN
jgi:hypothetical protein